MSAAHVIARKELREMLRERRIVAAGALVAALLVGSLLAGAIGHRARTAEADWARSALRAQWLDQGEKNPHSAAHFGTYAVQPRLAGALLDRGIEPFTGATVWLEAHRQNELRFRPAQDGSALERFGELGAAAVLQLWVPLLIALLAFDAFPRERAQGTLALLVASGVRPATLVRGKLLALAGALALLLAPAAAIGAGALAALAGPQALLDAAPRLGLQALVYALYLSVFALGALAVSAAARSSRTALVALLGFWALSALLVPRLATDAARSWLPTPSSTEFAEAVARDLRDGLDGRTPEDQRMAELEARVLAEYGVSHTDELPVAWSGLRLQEREAYGGLVFDRHFGQLWERFEAQNRLASWGSWLSPLLPVRALSMGLAGTDFDHQRHFASAAEAYRRSFIGVLNDDIARGAAGVEGPYLAGAELWASIPDFEYDSPGVGWVLARQGGALAGLGAWLALAAAALTWTGSRLRVG